jgi:hypothetical protein
MNTCHVVKELSSYLDNQLSGEERQKIDEHLKVCRICAQELSQLKALSEKLKAWQAPDAGPFFEQTVKDTIAAGGIERSAAKMKAKPNWYLVPAGVCVGIMVLAFVGPMYVKRGFQGRVREVASTGVATMREQYDPSNGISAMRAPYEPQYSSMKMDVATESNGRAVYGQAGNAPQAEPQGEGPVIVIQPALPATGVGERIIRTAEIRLEVENGQEAYKKASAICQELGGYLAASNFYQDKEGREAGTVTLRIPKDKFLIALDKLGGLGKMEGSSSQSRDVSQEFSNLKARLDAAMVVYNKMIEALQKRQVTIPEAARLESELSPVLARVEQLKNQIDSLNNLVSFTTITVQYHEPLVSAKALKDSRKYIEESILTAKINGVKFLAAAIPAAIVIVICVIGTIALYALGKFLFRLIFKRG